MKRLDKLKTLGHEIPVQPKPQGWYVPVVKTGSLIFVSGQLPMREGVVVFSGKVGETLTLNDGRDAARLCLLNILAALEGHGISLDSILRVVKLTGFVQCTPDFFDQPKVINAASELLVEVFGDSGRHARAAVGAVALPLNSAVEIEGVFEVAD